MVTEAESAAGVMIAQDMLYVYWLLLSLELEVKLSVIFEMNNKGAVDLAYKWSVGDCTRHVDVWNFFLRELKDERLLVIKHIPGEENEEDIFRENTVAQIFERHVPKFIRTDEYLKAEI